MVAARNIFFSKKGNFLLSTKLNMYIFNNVKIMSTQEQDILGTVYTFLIFKGSDIFCQRLRQSICPSAKNVFEM